MSIITNIVISRSSLAGADFKEAIDLGLVCAAFDQQVNMIFVDAGINNLIEGQTASKLNDKNHVDIIRGLEFYDIENIYLEKESLDNTRLRIDDLIPSVEIITSADINKLNQKANHLVLF